MLALNLSARLLVAALIILAFCILFGLVFGSSDDSRLPPQFRRRSRK